MNLLESAGRGLIDRMTNLSSFGVLLYITLRSFLRNPRHGTRAAFDVALKQIVFTGYDAMALISVIALGIGTISVMQTVKFLPGVGGEKLIGEILVIIIMKEVGPLLTAFVVIGRSATAMAIETGYMQVLGETEALQSLGIDPLKFVVLPRIISGVVSMFCLTIYFNVVAFIGGITIVSLTRAGASFSVLVQNLISSIEIGDILVCASKSLLFGLIISVVACYNGFSVKEAMTEVPVVTIKTVVFSLTYCLVVDVVLTIVAL